MSFECGTFRNPSTTRRRWFYTLAAATARAASRPAEEVLIRNVRIFNGDKIVKESSLLIREGRIVVLGRKLRVSNTTEVIDGHGKTLLPGLIDAHAHTMKRESLADALRFGVTTQIDLGTPSVPFAATMREEQLRHSAADRADLFSAGRVVTAPGGHGSQFGVPTLQGPEHAERSIADRIAEGSQFIKVILEDRGGRIPTLSEVTFKAAVSAAKRRGMLAVVHAKTTEHARWAAEAGASGLTHAYYLGPVIKGLPELLRERRMFVIPTLTVYEAVWDLERRSELLHDDRISPFLTSEGVDQLKRQLLEMPARKAAEEQYATAATNVRRLFEAGVPILAGSDAPNPGTVHGASLHRELELLVKAGLPALHVLRSATSLPARYFRLDGRGVVAQGGRADLVLVNGYPDRDITAARDIVAIWKEGRRFDRTVVSQLK